MEIPQIQIIIPSQCILKYLTFKKNKLKTTAEGIEKSSIIITDVILVIV
jgi:hypothetical protein